MSVFLTPDLQPFYGGTYWPPSSRMGMPGFDQVLQAVADAWANRRAQAIEHAGELTRHVAAMSTPAQSEHELSHKMIDQAGAHLEMSFDHAHGGFGGAPKFPHPMDLQVMLRLWKRHRHDRLLEMVTKTLEKMAAGGIYDHLGGGFHRYSVDERWLVPHFEKMLYDNALLINAYVEGFLATGNAEFARVARETCDYVLRDMTDPAGGFYSTEDADSEGEEGKFYVWTPQEIAAVLGEQAAADFCYVYDVSEPGNFEGHNILNLPKSIEVCAKVRHRDPEELRAELTAARVKLLEVRNRRVRPGRDDKVLVAWNGLMIDALARAAGALDEPQYLDAAMKAAGFILKEMRRPDGRLLHTWRAGKAKVDAYLDDYAALANALVSLYEATFNEQYIDDAVRLVEIMLAHFADRESGGFFYTADDQEQLIARHKDVQDGSVPSGNALAATVLVRLGKLTGRMEYLQAAEKTFRMASMLLERAPTAAGQMLLALDMYLGPTPEIVLLGNLAMPTRSQSSTNCGRILFPTKWSHCERPVLRVSPNRSIRSLQGNQPAQMNRRCLFAKTSVARRRQPVARLRWRTSKHWSAPNDLRRLRSAHKKAGAVGHESLWTAPASIKRINFRSLRGCSWASSPKILFEQPLF